MALHLSSILGQGTFLYSVLILLKKVGNILFDNLPEAKKYIKEQKEIFHPLT